MAAAAAAVAGISSGSNLLGSLGTAGLQIYGNTLNNQQQYSNTLNLGKYAESAYQEAGLPRYLAWENGGSSSLPGQKYQVAGANFYSAGPVNSNLPFYSSSTSQFTHNSTPRPNANQGARIPPWNEPQGNNEMIQFVRGQGQNDRLGLGFGRYGGPNNFVQGGPMLAAAAQRNQPAHIAAARALQ